MVFVGGCIQELPNIGIYRSLSTIATSGGSAKDVQYVTQMTDKEIAVWGFLDHDNISFQNATFNLNRYKNEGAGKGVYVRLSGEKNSYVSLLEKLQALEETPPVKILVIGVLRTYKQAYNFGSDVGIYLEVKNPKNIKIIKQQDADY